MNPSRNWNLRRRRRRRPEALLSFLKSRIHQSVGFQAQSSQDYISPVPLPQLSKEEGEGNFKQVWEASRLAFGRLLMILHKNPWTSGVFLTNNSRAMMHKRQHWSKFKILKVQNMLLSRSVCNWLLPLSDPPYSFPLLGGSTKQCWNDQTIAFYK